MSSSSQRPPQSLPGAEFASRPSQPGGFASRPSQPGGGVPQGGAVRGFGESPAITALCMESLDGALELVRADGGEVALLNEPGTAMVSRVERKRPPHLGGYGTPSRPSQPMRQSIAPDDPSTIDSQVTQLLPSLRRAPVYLPGQSLVGQVWQRREPIQQRQTGEPLDGQFDGTDGEVPTAHHLAVPIFHPDTLDQVRGRGPVIGVLRVFNREALWPYSANDRLLLEMHADRLGRTLALFDPRARLAGRGDLGGMLRELSGVAPTLTDLMERVSEIAARQINAVGFLALLIVPGSDDIAVEFAVVEGVRQPRARMPITDLPPWIRRGLFGELTLERAPAGGRPGVMSALGWTGDTPPRSGLAAPLLSRGRTLGALVALSPQVDAYSQADASLFETLTLAAAIFTENARLVEDARRSVVVSQEQRRQLSALNNSVQTLNASLDVNTTLQSLAQQASLLTTAQACAVFLREKTADGASVFVCHAVHPPEREPGSTLLDAVIPLTWRDFGERLSETTFLIEEPEEGKWEGPATVSGRLDGAGVTSFLALPISRQENFLGALVIYSPGQAQRYVPEEIVLLQGLASQAGIAIANARLYEELESAYEQLKELDRLKDDFILTVSHEFRTPLTAIEGYVTLITKHGDKLDREKLQTFAGEIHQATLQLAGMISMLADANRMSSQPLRITPHPIQLAGAAGNAMSAQAPEVKERILMRLPEDLWALGDEERLPLIFSNLISNAIKYSGAGKACRVVARAVTRQDLVAAGRAHAVAENAPADWILVTVEDDGPGISLEDQAKLFQKFVRLAHSLVTPVRGTGLGLWICRQYVEAMGGDIWVDSQIGRGSRFCFCLPRAATPAN